MQRIDKLHTWLSRLKYCCKMHLNQLRYGTDMPAEWWNSSVAGGEQDAAGDSAASFSGKCVLCDSERVNDIEVRNTQLVLENESIKKSVQDADELVYRMEQRMAHREGRLLDPRMTSSSYLVERLRLLDASVARVATDFDHVVETRQRLERVIEKQDHDIALLNQQSQEAIDGTLSLDEVLKQERSRVTAVGGELENAKSKISMLEDSLRQKSAELEDSVAQFDRLRTEAKTRVRSLKLQLETKEQDYRNLSDAESRLSMELTQVSDELAAVKTSFQQYKDDAQHRKEDRIHSVSIAPNFVCHFSQCCN